MDYSKLNDEELTTSWRIAHRYNWFNVMCEIDMEVIRRIEVVGA